MERIIDLTFDEWQNRRFPDSVKYVSGAFKRKLLCDSSGEWRLYSLSEVEYQKIVDARNDIFEGCVAFFLKGLMEIFEQQFLDSKERETLVRLEIERVNQYLADKDLLSISFPFSYPNGDNGVKLLGALSREFLKIGVDANILPKWFEMIIVRGKDARIYAEPGHERVSDYLPAAFAVHVLYEYKEFLESKLTAPAAPLETDLRPLAQYFESKEKLDLALKAAIEKGLLNEVGKWEHFGGHKTKAISVFWRAAVKAELAKADAPIYKVIDAVKEQFSVHFGQNAIDKKKDIADFGEEYKELYKSLLAIMRP